MSQVRKFRVEFPRGITTREVFDMLAYSGRIRILQSQYDHLGHLTMLEYETYAEYPEAIERRWLSGFADKVEVA